jgi:hypothetical protein
MRPRSRDAPRVRPPDMCGRFPSLQTGPASRVIVSGADQIGTLPLLWGQSEIRDGAANNCEPTYP